MKLTLESDHPLAQSHWHGQGLTLRRRLTPTQIVKFSSDIKTRFKQVHGELESLKSQNAPAEHVEKKRKHAEKLRDLYHGLHHKPIQGTHDQWEGKAKKGAVKIDPTKSVDPDF